MTSLLKQLYLLILLSLFVCLPSCESLAPENSDEPVELESVVYDPLAKPFAPGTWTDPEGIPGSPKIVVDTKAQRAYFYKGGVLVGDSPISSGKPGRSTPKGTYTVQEKSFVRYSSAFGVIRDNKTHEVIMDDFNTRKDRKPANGYYEAARMAYCLRFYNGYCFHEGYVPGYPASHGCVRIVPDMAPHFYKYAKVGMTFVVK